MTFEERAELKAKIDAAVREQVFTTRCPGCDKPIPRTNKRIYCSHACGSRHYYHRSKDARAA